MFFDELLGVLYPFGIDIAYGDNPGLLESQNLSQIAEPHTAHTDAAHCYTITRCAGSKH
jgi:hypothetical protein